MVHSRSTSRALVVGAMAALLALAGCSSGNTGAATPGATREADTGTVESGSGDITAYCGETPAKVAYLKSAGGNTWVLQSGAEFLDEASKCDNIQDPKFSQQIGDQQAAIADLASVVAQGYNVVVISADYGAAELPGIQAATEAGVEVVTILGDAGGTPGQDFLEAVVFDQEAIAQAWAEFLVEQLPDGGTVAYLGGTAGNETSTGFFAAFQEAIAEHPEFEIVDDRIQDTNWDPVERRQVMAGLLANHGRIDAIVSDFNAPDIGALQAYDEAGMERPVVASITPSNQLACDWEENPYPWLTFGETSSLPRLALRIGLAAFEGIENTESPNVLPAALEYLPDGEQPTCNEDFPLDADLTANLTQAQLEELFAE